MNHPQSQSHSDQDPTIQRATAAAKAEVIAPRLRAQSRALLAALEIRLLEAPPLRPGAMG